MRLSERKLGRSIKSAIHFLGKRRRAAIGWGAWFVLAGSLSILEAALVVPAVAASVVIIKNDRGGNIGQYWTRFTAIRDAKERVIIDGVCSSACTMVLGIVPRDRICVTRNARFGFHAAWRPGFLGLRTTNKPATQTLWNLYPNPIRLWIARNGGLGSDTIYLSGSELLAMYPECR